jgi:hypothetical protein
MAPYGVSAIIELEAEEFPPNTLSEYAAQPRNRAVADAAQPTTTVNQRT